MPVAPGNRLYTAFPVRLMFVFPAICPQKVETRLIYKDKLEFKVETRLIYKDKLEFNRITIAFRTLATY